jgi:hypothetical protein
MAILQSSPPKGSLIKMEMIDFDVVALKFPRSQRLYLGLLILLIGIGISLFVWQSIIRLAQLDFAALFEKGLIRGVVFALTCLILGIMVILSHTRVTLTKELVCRSWNIAGVNLLRFQAKFKNIKDIVIGNDDSGDPIIKIFTSEKKYFAIVDFDIIEERDWLATELIRIWHDCLASIDDLRLGGTGEK